MVIITKDFYPKGSLFPKFGITTFRDKNLRKNNPSESKHLGINTFRNYDPSEYLAFPAELVIVDCFSSLTELLKNVHNTRNAL